MFDTHCHLNFKRFNKTRETVILDAWKAGLTGIVVPGTDIFSSQKAVEIAQQHKNMYAAVGIHPHHVKEYKVQNLELRIKEEMQKLRLLLAHPKVVAVGEVGIDAFQYTETKYKDYVVSPEFIQAQKTLFEEQILLAIEYDKSLIVHCREVVDEVLQTLIDTWDKKLEGRSVFHCCEPDEKLLQFAKDHSVYIGVDGDVTYGGKKAEFVKTVPLEMLVVETDSPYLLPEPMRSRKEYPNEPKYIPVIVSAIARLHNIDTLGLQNKLLENTYKLFNLSI